MIKDYKPVSNTDYILLIDDSSSMAKNDFEPNRLTSAKSIAKKWIEVLPNSTRLGLVAFSKDIDLSTGLIQNKNLALNKLNEIQIDYTKSGTDLDYAISYSVDLLNENNKEDNYKINKTILLLTDGTESITNTTIFKAKNNNVRIIAFGIGDNAKSQEELINVPREFRLLEQTGVTSFISFWSRINKVMLTSLTNNPVNALTTIFLDYLIGEGGVTIFDSNIFNKASNDSLVHLPSLGMDVIFPTKIAG
jgi:uncharacterized protein YegL